MSASRCFDSVLAPAPSPAVPARPPPSGRCCGTDYGTGCALPRLTALAARTLTKPGRHTDADTLPWRARKETYLAHLEHAAPEVLLVSACDKLHNARAIGTDLRALGPAVFDRFTGGRDGTLWYYGALSALFSRRMPGPLAADLAEAVAAMGRLATEPRPAA